MHASCNNPHQRSSPARKPLGLKRAIAFFKNFGRKSSAGKQTFVEMATDESQYNGNATNSRRSPQEPYDRPPVYEMSGRTTENVNVVELEGSDHSHHTSRASVVYELHTSDLVPPELVRPESLHYGLLRPEMEVRHPELPSPKMGNPTSDGLLAFSTNDAGQVGSMDAPNSIVSLPWSVPCSSGFPLFDLPAQTRDLFDPFPPASCFNKSSSADICPLTEVLVEDLHRRVSDLENQWRHQLSPTFDFFWMKENFCQPSLFETGFRTLQGLYRCISPRTFEDVFALMHVAFACACKYQNNDEPKFWGTFFEDALRWCRAVATAQERDVLLRVVFQIWCPEFSINRIDNSFVRCGSMAPDPTNLPAPWILLEKSAVIKACTPFLDSKLLLA